MSRVVAAALIAPLALTFLLMVAAYQATATSPSCDVAESGSCDDHELDVEPAGTDNYASEAMGADGLTPRTRRIMSAVVSRFGVANVGGFCLGGCTSGHIIGSDHYTGHAVDFMLLPINERNRQLGDRVATWLVSNARSYAVKYVIWREQIWSAARTNEGWRPYEHPSGAGGPTLQHRDHVHVSVY